MSLQVATTAFLRYLHAHRALRRQIRAAPDTTLLYAGSLSDTIGARLGLLGFNTPVWKDIEKRKLTDEQFRGKQILPEVLERVPAPDTGYRSLRQYVTDVEGVLHRSAPKDAPDYLVIWRALSGIFAANATGAVSFWLGSESGMPNKVFASTEVWVLLRNPKIDQVTRDVLGYYKGCLERGEQHLALSILRK